MGILTPYRNEIKGVYPNTKYVVANVIYKEYSNVIHSLQNMFVKILGNW